MSSIETEVFYYGYDTLANISGGELAKVDFTYCPIDLSVYLADTGW